ncbi:flagellar biosynthesis protein FlhB [Kordiimonas aquimaris]|uniref:flagellar biosynthesis protein FlhB n=1 Tax=Kordiimonas aquimaris TaxID=707591 RepID=UPI0021CF22A0|nr:flagellar biosynthesis protein FlhB [Kordiimonas aquimaris]
MADEDEAQKTEEPTPKKLQEATEKGEVAQSQEVKTWFMLAAGTGVVAGAGAIIVTRVRDPLVGYLSRIHEIDTQQVNALKVLNTLMFDVFFVLLIPFGVFVFAALAGNRIQHSGVFTFEKLKPDLSKINPLQGMKKFGSSRMPVEFGKAVAKLLALSLVLFLVAYPERSRLDTVMLLPIIDVVGLAHIMAVKVMLGVMILMTIIAALDFSYQKYQHIKKLRMTKQEVKDERKQTDGDPKVKSRLRQIRFERHSQRMMAAVPRADVVITNPTHYAIALEYKHGHMDVPVLIAKGVDNVALRIRGLAEEHDIPIIENPPLARALYASVELDEEIPPDHYKAVAGVITYIMKLQKAGLGRKSNTLELR